jgi:uncharacterized membrane protein YbhN (UPF0104 family)
VGSRRKGRLSWIARVLVATAAILWVFHGQDWRDLGAVFRSLSLAWFAFSLAVFVVAQMAIGLRWWLLLRAQSIHISLLAAVRLYFLGLFYNNVMPGAVGGDLLKAWYVTKHTDRKVAGALSVLADRVIGLAVLVLMAIPAYAVFVRGEIAGEDRGEQAAAGGILPYGRVVVWAGVAGVAVLTVLLIHPYGRMRLRLAAGHAWIKGLALLRAVREAVAVYCSKPGMLMAVAGLTLFSQSTVILAFWLLGRNLGIGSGLGHYFVVFPVMWVVSAVPVSIAGLGVFEAGVVKMFGFLAGVPAEQAMVLALCQRFIWVLASLPGGVIHLVGAHLPEEDISIDVTEAGN